MVSLVDCCEQVDVFTCNVFRGVIKVDRAACFSVADLCLSFLIKAPLAGVVIYPLSESVLVDIHAAAFCLVALATALTCDRAMASASEVLPHQATPAQER